MTNLEGELDLLLNEINSSAQDRLMMSCRDIIPLIDLTLLDSQATSQAIRDLATKATLHQVAAICVYPEHLNDITTGIQINKATVVNFPTGNEPQQQLLKTVQQIISFKKINEIDYVFPYQDYLNGKQQQALDDCQEIFSLCKRYGLTFKVIIETGALPSNQLIYQLSLSIIDKGCCDFLKTSTGKIAQGATIPAAFSILQAIKDSQSTCGLKVSGGIKTPKQAWSYMTLAQKMLNRTLNSSWFRIGASSLLDECNK